MFALPFSLGTVSVKVIVGGQNVYPINLVLTQEYADHHHFEITLDYDVYGDDFMSSPMKHIDLIGQSVIMNFSHKINPSDCYLFRGVITNVKQTGKEGKKGYLIVSGSSPTVMLEKGKRMDVYSNKTLRGIFDLIASRANPIYMNHVANPLYGNRVDFLMQYNETDWEFLKRVAYLYKENLFYSGVEILFGKYEEWEPVKLTYDKEITDLEFCSRMHANNSEYYQYVADRDTTIETKSPEKIENSNEFLDIAEKQNIALTDRKPAKSYMDTPVYDSLSISEILKREKSRNAGQTITIKGKSKTYKSTIGRLINVGLPSILSLTSNIGTYRVIKSVHRIDENQRYSCEFEAVPASLDTMPVKEPKMPTADSVVGKIRSNEDPLGQGRVQVDFDFASNYNFSWLRVLTPNAGSSKAVAQNRGMVFIPEKGDQVMVGFEYGDPNRPYVMGSLYHGKNGHGGGEENNIKSITTRSGIQITFNDQQGSLNIKDPSGNTINMDGKGNISISAPKTISLSATDIKLNASNAIDLKAEPQKEGAGEGTISISALKSIEAVAQTEGINLTAEQTFEAKSNSADVSLTASTDVTVKAVDINNIADGSLGITASSKVSISGNDVAINE